MPTHKPTETNKAAVAKLTPSEKRRRIQLSRAKAEKWAAANSAAKSKKSTTTSSSTSTVKKKRKARASPPSSPDTVPLDKSERKLGTTTTVSDEESSPGRRSRDVVDGAKESGTPPTMFVPTVPSTRRSSRVKKKVRSGSPVVAGSGNAVFKSIEQQEQEQQVKSMHEENASFTSLDTAQQQINRVDSASVQVPSVIRPLPSKVFNPYKNISNESSLSNIAKIGQKQVSSFSVPIRKDATVLPPDESHNSTMKEKITEQKVNDEKVTSQINEQGTSSTIEKVESPSTISTEVDEKERKISFVKVAMFSRKAFIFVAFVIILSLVFFPSNIEIPTMNGSKANNLSCFVDKNMFKRDAQKHYNGKLPMVEVKDSKTGIVTGYTFVPSELQSIGITSCNPPSIHCPRFGRCYGGFLIDCEDLTENKFGENTLIKSNDHKECVISPLGKKIIDELQSTLEEITVNQVCNAPNKRFSFFRSSGDFETKSEPISFSALAEKIATKYTEKNVTFTYPGIAGIDRYTIQKMTPLFDEKVFEIDDNTIRLTSSFLSEQIKIPLRCWLHLMLIQIFQVLWNLIWSLTFSAMKYYVELLYNQPMYCLLLTTSVLILNFIRKRRKDVLHKRDEVSRMRELAYDMLVMADDSYAVSHLRDTITNKMYPISLKERKRVSESVWPKVVKEVKHDSRIRKIEKNIGGHRSVHWEWISIPAKKERRSLLLSPFVKTNDTANSHSPTVEELKRNLL